MSLAMSVAKKFEIPLRVDGIIVHKACEPEDVLNEMLSIFHTLSLPDKIETIAEFVARLETQADATTQTLIGAAHANP